MLKGVREYLNFRIRAKDGDIGKILDFYFDDARWVLRYLIADTGTWLPGRQVLISTAAFSGRPDIVHREFPVELDKDTVLNSPDVDADKPVSRQKEIELNKYYRWPMYWNATAQDLTAMGVVPEPVPVFPERESGDSHLRSVREVDRYHIQAENGSIGHVLDFIVDDEKWAIHYLEIDTGNWLPGKKVLISPAWIKMINWNESRVYVNLTREAVGTSPAYDLHQPITQDYEDKLHKHYGRQKHGQSPAGVK